MSWFGKKKEVRERLVIEEVLRQNYFFGLLHGGVIMSFGLFSAYSFFTGSTSVSLLLTLPVVISMYRVYSSFMEFEEYRYLSPKGEEPKSTGE